MKLKFEFFNSQNTKVSLQNTDCKIYVSPTAQSPNAENCLASKTEFKDPYMTLFRELQGKTFPEFNPTNKSERFP